MPVTDDLRAICPPQSQREMSHPDQLFRASGLHKCPRLQLLDAKGIHLQLPQWLLRKFSLHDGAHSNVCQWLQDRFSGIFPVLLEEVVYDPLSGAGGHIDCVIVDDQIAYVIEIKTYLHLPKGDPKANSYWQHQISFYYHTIADQERWLFVQPVIFIAGFGGEVRVIEPVVTEAYREILAGLNLAWETDTLPGYMDCYGLHECRKCPLQRVCTEPIDSVAEFAVEVTARSQNAEM